MFFCFCHCVSLCEQHLLENDNADKMTNYYFYFFPIGFYMELGNC